MVPFSMPIKELMPIVTIRLVEKVCRDCGLLIDQCKFQIGLRKFGWDKFADSISEEVIFPEWTSSNGLPAQSITFTDTG